MTTRNKFNSIIETNKKAYSSLKGARFRNIILIIICAAGVVLHYLHFGKLYNFFLLGLIFYVLTSLFMDMKTKKEIIKLKCPKCEKELDYLLLGQDYNPQDDYTAFPVTIKQCPFCKFDFDVNTD